MDRQGSYAQQILVKGDIKLCNSMCLPVVTASYKTSVLLKHQSGIINTTKVQTITIIKMYKTFKTVINIKLIKAFKNNP